jgi:hypothetical protein
MCSMLLDEVLELVRQVAATDIAGRDRAALTATAAALGRLRSWVEHRELVVGGALAAVDAVAEHTLARASRQAVRDANRAVERAVVAESIPTFGAALAAGDVSGAHLDALGRGWRRLDPRQRPDLAAHADRLLSVAGQSTPEEFERTVAATVRRLEGGDGTARLERQRRASRLRTWVDRSSGMWCWRGELDPETGAGVAGRLAAMVDTLFTEKLPDTSPSDPGERQDHLRALALVALTECPGAAGRCELNVVIDTAAVHPAGGPTVDWGIPVEIPAAVLADLAGTADIHAVIITNGAVLHAPGRLDLGRTTRIANRAQRRALRALYPTCALPGCGVGFDFCKIHHIIWWHNGGRTDLVNLLPVCDKHHHAIHDHGWRVALANDRTLTLTLPDGTRQTTGPPTRKVAA